MPTKLTCRYFWIILLALLAACEPLVPAQTVTPMATDAPSVLPTETPLVPSPTPLPPFPLEILHMAYVVDDNLYLQDGSNPPIQLTHSKEGRIFEFSDDGEKIVFYRQGMDVGDEGGTYSINADGSREQVLITKKMV
jgi:hypothetical protein